MMPKPRVYLAGPDVFREDATTYGQTLVECAALQGIEAVFPLDSVVQTSEGIYLNNRELIDSCSGVIANLSPFRGPDPDSGTCWELGYAASKGKIIVAYSCSSFNLYQHHPYFNGNKDSCFPVVENFGLSMNLMLHHGADFQGAHNYSDALVEMVAKLRSSGLLK